MSVCFITTFNNGNNSLSLFGLLTLEIIKFDDLIVILQSRLELTKVKILMESVLVHI